MRSCGSIILRTLALALVLLVAVGSAVPALAAGGDSKGKAKGKAKRDENAPVSLFVPVDRLSMPLTRFDNRQVGLLDLDISIEAANEAAVGKIQEAMPRIRDRLLTRFKPQASEGVSLSAEALTDMKGRILTLLRDLLGVDGVKAIYIMRALAVPV